ncbi:hypothetical protein GALMADRAFT_147333 [Galerina marginata CBS 339.88]|uniref:Uncharacterized protein n=1 Tax=Galerina marginata (strain CBS 339.88) TaxID=685588 RepID=A0A067SAV9_GALM3|nr:hypothetical protein GALMADRAFT_147333 [Galerina marginata CBS 339.88]
MDIDKLDVIVAAIEVKMTVIVVRVTKAKEDGGGDGKRGVDNVEGDPLLEVRDGEGGAGVGAKDHADEFPAQEREGAWTKLKVTTTSMKRGHQVQNGCADECRICDIDFIAPDIHQLDDRWRLLPQRQGADDPKQDEGFAESFSTSMTRTEDEQKNSARLRADLKATSPPSPVSGSAPVSSGAKKVVSESTHPGPAGGFVRFAGRAG